MSLAPPGSKAGRLHIGKIKLERFLRPDLMTSLGGTELLDRSSSVVMVAEVVGVVDTGSGSVWPPPVRVLVSHVGRAGPNC